MLASEDLASSFSKFALLFHPRLLDSGIVDFNILEFKFAGAHPWTFPPVPICLFLLKLVKAFRFPSELRFSALEHAQLRAPSVPIYTDRSKFSEGVGCVAVFLYFDVFISLPAVASIFTAELFAIFLDLSRISLYDSDSFVIYSDSRSALQTLGSLYTRNPIFLKIQCFLCDLSQICLLLLYSLTCRALLQRKG